MAQQTTPRRGRPGAQNPGRMIGHGMNVEDFLEITKRTECDCYCVGPEGFIPTPEDQREDFVSVCVEVGDRNAAYAQKEEEAGHLVTAEHFYGRATACYRLADYGIQGITDEKLEVYSKIPETFKRQYALSREHVESIEVPFGDTSMPAYFAIPDGTPSDSPVMVFIPGATGFKEENFSSAWYFYERGIPFIIFDGPGQGESLYYRHIYLTPDNYVEAVRAVIDYVKADPRVGTKVALYGISFGGFLATQAACALNDDLSGLIVRGGTDKADDLTKHPWMGIPNFYLNGFLSKFGTDDVALASELSTQMDCTALLGNITAPLLIIHSEEDPIQGVEGAKRIFAGVSSTDKLYSEWPGNTHCVDDQHDTVSSLAADWMADRLLA